MSMHAYPSAFGQQERATTNLPTMADFKDSMGYYIPLADDRPKTCGICWEDFRPFVLDFYQNIVCLPCGHIFHHACCMEWMGSTASNRNSCPECRKEFCLHNALSPEQEATMRVNEAAHNEEMSPFNTEAYSWFLEQTDILYQRTKRVGPAIYTFVSILHRASLVWRTHRRPDEFICDEHAEVGDDWIELAAANRIRSRLTEDDLIDSKEGQDFVQAHVRLMDLVNTSADHVSEVWEQSSHDDQEYEETDTESENDELSDSGLLDSENWEESEDEDEDTEIKEEPSASPDSQSHADPMDGIMIGNDVVARLSNLEQRVSVLTENSHHALATRTSTTQPSEPQQPTSEEDQLFPLPSAAEIARLPLPDSAVLQRELVKTRDWIESENCIIVCEMRNVTSVEFHGGRLYVPNNSHGLVGFVRDADAYHMVGSYAIFYRFGEEQ
jgi:hypothetical protein